MLIPIHGEAQQAASERALRWRRSERERLAID
jgi:hypothetical protein